MNGPTEADRARARGFALMNGRPDDVRTLPRRTSR
jgi:hypothetical protein